MILEPTKEETILKARLDQKDIYIEELEKIIALKI
jgi:hypothetical protein